MTETKVLDYGKLPPQAIALEEVLIGCLLIDAGVISRVQSIVTENSFYKDGHRMIFKAISDLERAGKGIDIMLVTEKLRSIGKLDEVGGPFYVTKLTERIGSTANAEKYAQIIQTQFIRRNLIRFASEIEKQAFDETIDIADTIGLIGTTDFGIPQQLKSIKEIAENNFKEICGKVNGDIDIYGIQSGLDIDKITLGFQKQTLTIIASRPGMGKTAFMVTLLKYFNEKHTPAAVNSLEMSVKELAMRLLINGTGIHNEQIKRGQLNAEELAELENITEYIKKSSLYINDKSGLNLNQVRIFALEMKRKHGIKILLIDYLQLMSGVYEKGKIQNREAEIAQISRGLKGIAKELDIPVVAFAQLNRNIESTSRLPILADLRESGAIEQDADVVLFLNRYEKRGIMEYPNGGESTEGAMDADIAKHRNGATSLKRLVFDKETMTVKNDNSRPF